MKTAFSELTSKEAIKLLTELGDGEAVSTLSIMLDQNPSLSNTKLSELPDTDMPGMGLTKWKGTEHTFGYITNLGATGDLLDIQPATTIQADPILRGQQVNIKLGRLYTMNYPGWGRHNVLMHFKCKHAKEGSNETAVIEFEQKFKSKEGESAGNLGNFVFLGLRVPSNGLEFEVQTINVSNDNDDEALKVLESDTIKNGLDLVNTTFASLAPFT